MTWLALLIVLLGGSSAMTIIADGGHAPPADLAQRIVDFFKAVSTDAAR